MKKNIIFQKRQFGRLIRGNNRLIRQMENPNVSNCIVAGYYKDGKNNQYIADNKVKKIIGMYDNNNTRHQAGSVYDPNGLSPTLTNMSSGGNKQPFILVNEGTKKGYVEATEGDSINIAYPNNLTKRGRVGKKVSNTILTSPNIAVLENANKVVEMAKYKKMYNPYNDKEITDIAPTQTATCGCTTSSSTVLISEDGKNYMRIRKLTPFECWRLMGFDDTDFYKAKSVGISDTQLYKMAGNSIVVNVLEFIFKELFTDESLEKCA